MKVRNAKKEATLLKHRRNTFRHWKEFGNSILKNRVLLSIILIKIASELNENGRIFRIFV